MKRFIRYATSAVLALGMSSAWAQLRDLDVTMDVVPANASANSATGEIKLPIVLPPTASGRARDASAFGHGTANLAHDKGDLSGRDFGQAVSEAAQQRNQSRNPPGKSKSGQ